MAHVVYSRTRTKKELENETMKGLRAIAHDRFAVANKRIQRLQKAGYEDTSPALKALIERRGSNPKFVQGGKDFKALLREISECYAFLNLETSTVQGTKSYMKQITSMVGSGRGSNEISRLFRLLDKVQERIPPSIFGRVVDTNQEMQQITQIIDNDSSLNLNQMDLSADEQEQVVTKAIEDILDKIDEENRRAEQTFTDLEKQFRSMF